MTRVFEGGFVVGEGFGPGGGGDGGGGGGGGKSVEEDEVGLGGQGRPRESKRMRMRGMQNGKRGWSDEVVEGLVLWRKKKGRRLRGSVSQRTWTDSCDDKGWHRHVYKYNNYRPYCEQKFGVNCKYCNDIN